MKPTAPLALALCLAAAIAPALLQAQSPPTFTDPANLRGERVAPLTGRELPIDQGASGLQQLLRKLNTRASIMNIVAHPDDEDGGMMTLYSRGLGARVADLSLTRGEGGQNAMTADFEDALGLLRTQELLSSDRYPGIDQFFGTEVDFGFSKTKEESFAKWTHERVLYDVVRAIRLYRPLVLTSTWIGGVTDGHGQHQVSGEIAQEAFVAAGNPKIFSELTAEGILPWQPLRIYARVPMQSISEKGLFDYATDEYTPARFTNYVTGAVTTTPPTTDVVVHEGIPDPLLANENGKPRTYVQFARIGLGLQKSQVGPGFRNPPPGAFDVAYHLYGTAICQHNAPTLKNCHPEQREGPAVSPAAANPLNGSRDPNFFTNIDTSLESIATLAPDAPSYLPDTLTMISARIDQATSIFNPKDPSAIAPILGDTLSKLDALIPRLESASFDPTERENVLHELCIKQVQLNQAVALALGLTFDATTTAADVTTGSSVAVWVNLHTHFSDSLTVKKLWLTTSQGEVPSRATTKNETPELTDDRPSISTLNVTNGYTSDITRPYFFRDNIETPVYQLKIPALRDAPQTPPAIVAHAQLDYRGTTIDLLRIVHDGPQPVNIVPAASLSLSTHAQVLPNDAKSVLLGTTLYPIEKPATEPKLSLPVGWKYHVAISDTNAPGQMGFVIEVPTSPRETSVLKSSTHFKATGQTYTEGYRPIGYGDLPHTNYFTPANTRIVPGDLKLPTHHNIGYLPGTGDSIPEALASIGLPATTLTVADLTSSKLAQYDTVILGVRAYNAHPNLHGAPTKALLDYARNGGNVLVQYQTPEFTGDDAPYPLSLGSNEKVVDETASVHLLTPHSSNPQTSTGPEALLSQPNLITPADFNNWIEERGHGFLSTWDLHYTALTETHDPSQAYQRGGLITTQFGKGRWTYVAFALYRQLPEAVPGAYRLFLNLLNP